MQDYSALLKTFEVYLVNNRPNGSPDSLYSPVRYINELGGKRIRPVLLLMAYNLWFEDVTPALQAAMAVEYFHNFTLMHDDIMDEAHLRRGKESVHVKYGTNAAILSGDAMLIKSFEYLIDLENKYRLGSSISQVMAKTALEICEGQQMDMDFESGTAISEEEYLEMIRKKTAALIGSCLRIGSMLAGASTEVSDKLYACGEYLGIAFQIKDDLLDTFGDPNLTGKQLGADILRGKKNFSYVRTLNSLSEAGKMDFMEKYAHASLESEMAPVLEIYQSLKIDEVSKKIQSEYFDKAVNCLSNIPFVDTSMLKSFATELMSRDH